MRIAIDAMGGDNAPQEIISGALLAKAQLPDARLILVGDEPRIRAEFSRNHFNGEGMEILHTTQVVEMDDAPLESFRKKKDSSIRRAMDLVARADADAVVTAGNTGAMVACATFGLKLLEGVERAGIAVTLPTVSGIAILMDAGANLSCKPEHLLQYGLMAAEYAKIIQNKSNPTIGLLNIGHEEEKGTPLVKGANQLFKDASDKGILEYVGFVEGNEIYNDAADVIICDGFIGNTVLKVSEGLGQAMIDVLRNELGKSLRSKMGALLAREAFRTVKIRTDMAEYGGAPLLGVKGVCIKCHGRADAKAIYNGIRVACLGTRLKLNDRVSEVLTRASEWMKQAAEESKRKASQG